MIPLPIEFRKEIETMLDAEAPAFFASMEQNPTLAMRLNPRRKAAESAAEGFIDRPVPWAKYGYYLKDGARPGASIAHAAGAFYLQEASAMVSATVLDPRPGERILDLCAAPGGKSSQIAGLIGREGMLISNEPEPSRAKVLASNLERLGIFNAIVTNAYPDALAKKWEGYFDGVLCDAPCSGEGMFRRDPDSRTQWASGSPAGCAKRQAEILDQAAKLVRPGGRLVYSTCTFNRAENEETILAFLARHPEFVIEDFHLEGIGDSESGMIRVWPHKVDGDGHFAAKLRKAGDSRQDAPVYKLDKEAMKLVGELEKLIGMLPPDLKERCARLGDYVYAVPPECPDVKGLKLASNGLCLMRVGKNYVEPAHGLAMCFEPGDARSMELTQDQAVKYLAGEAIECGDERGWILICHQNMPLGWAKASNSLLKNHLPKGLRLSLHPQAGPAADTLRG